MIKDQCISVTDLRTKTKQCLEGLKNGPKLVFVNNKPVAMLMDISEEERDWFTLKPLPEEEVTPELLKLVEETKKMSEDEFLNI